MSNAVADATALAIDAGAGDDSITNHGELTATSVANADAIAVAAQGGGVAVAGNAFWDSGTEATAIAVGISGDGVDVDESVIGIVEAGDGEVRVFFDDGSAVEPPNRACVWV